MTGAATSPESISTDSDYGFRAPRFARPRNDELRPAPLRAPGTGTRAAAPRARADFAGKPAGAGGASPAGAHSDCDRAASGHFAGNRDGRVAGIGQRAVQNANRIAIAAVAIAFFGDDRDA